MATRRDVNAIAKAVKETKMDGMVREDLIYRLWDELRKENGLIIWAKFHDACTPDPEPIVVPNRRCRCRNNCGHSS